MEPVIYRDIARKLNQTKAERDQYIEEFIDPLRASIDSLKIPYRITGRPKSISSIHNKIKKKNVPFEEIYELFAVRIIVDVPHELEKQTKSEEHTSELQSRGHRVCRIVLAKKKVIDSYRK